MSLENWKSVFELGSIVLLGLTFVFGGGVFWTTREVNKKQAEELRQFQLQLTRARRETAEAQLALQQYVNVVAKSANPRHIDRKRFVELLQGQPKGTAVIWYQVPDDDDEARNFAFQIYQALGPEGAGWTVTDPPHSSWRKVVSRNPHVERIATGVALICKRIGPDLDSLQQNLRSAIDLSTGGWGIAGLEFSFEDPQLPDDYFVIIVGHHQVRAPLVTFPVENKPDK
jgi:hypothetical protein